MELFINRFATVSTGWNPSSSRIPEQAEPKTRAVPESFPSPPASPGAIFFPDLSVVGPPRVVDWKKRERLIRSFMDISNIYFYIPYQNHWILSSYNEPFEISELPIFLSRPFAWKKQWSHSCLMGLPREAQTMQSKRILWLVRCFVTFIIPSERRAKNTEIPVLKTRATSLNNNCVN